MEALDGYDGWSVTALGSLSPDIRIFKGPRLKSENIIVDDPGAHAERYWTPSAILQDKGDSVKYIDVSSATARQLATINAIRVYRGDIVITRSGSIGRVAYITASKNNAIVSDDLIRVRIPDESLRLYVFAYLQTQYARDQMLRNEYGAVQQHLEPEHIRNILVPIPDDEAIFRERVTRVRRSIRLRECLERASEDAVEGMAAAVRRAVNESGAEVTE